MVQKFLMAFMAALLSVGSAQAAKNLKKTGYNLCPDVSIKKGQWTGVYAGSWVSNGGAVTLPHALVVTRVRKSGQADVLYAVGRAKRWNTPALTGSGVMPRRWQRRP